MNDAQRIRAMVTKWCPVTCRDEPFELQIVRAFMQACACIADQDRAIHGLRPMVPLDFYPSKELLS